MELLKLFCNLFLLIQRQHEWERQDQVFLECSGSYNTTGLWVERTFSEKVLAQLAVRYPAILVLFTPAQKTVGFHFPISSPVPWVWIQLAGSLKSFQILPTCPVPALCLERNSAGRYENDFLKHINGCFCKTEENLMSLWHCVVRKRGAFGLLWLPECNPLGLPMGLMDELS